MVVMSDGCVAVGGSRPQYLFHSYVDFTYSINLDLTT
jgi:hypothetical protein